MNWCMNVFDCLKLPTTKINYLEELNFFLFKIAIIAPNIAYIKLTAFRSFHNFVRIVVTDMKMNINYGIHSAT